MFLLLLVIKQINCNQIELILIQYINKRMNTYFPLSCQFKKYRERVFKKNSCRTRTEESIHESTILSMRNIESTEKQEERRIQKKSTYEYLKPLNLQSKSVEKYEMKKPTNKNLFVQFSNKGDVNKNMHKRNIFSNNKKALPEIDKSSDSKIELNKGSMLKLKEIIQHKNNEILDFMIGILKDNEKASPKPDGKFSFVKKDNFFSQNFKNTDNCNKSSIYKSKNYGPRVLANSITREAKNVNVVLRRKLTSEQGERINNKIKKINQIHETKSKQSPNDYEEFEITFYPRDKNKSGKDLTKYTNN